MNTTHILIIEKSNHSNGGLHRLLDQAGFHVECSSGASAGLQRFRSSKFDLVITDVVHASGNGVDIVQSIRSANQATPVGVVLNNDDVYNVAEIVRAGANDVIATPFESSQVLRTIRNALRQAGKEIDIPVSQVEPRSQGTVFGRKFRELRKLTGISVKELAQIFQCSASYIYNIERGIRDPQTPFIIKACEVYGVSCDYMLRNRLQKDVVEKPEEIELISRYRKLPPGLRKAFLHQFRFQFRLYEKLTNLPNRAPVSS